MTDTKKNLSADLERVQTELDEALAQVEQLTITLRTVADFPITDPNNQDAISMAAIAASALPKQS